MKTIRQLQAKEEWLFLYNVILIDFFRIFLAYLVIWLIGYIFL